MNKKRDKKTLNKISSETLIKPIFNEMPNMTFSSQLILKYINSYPYETYNQSQRELAKNSFTSEASVNRFIKQYGFSHYRDFSAYINVVLSNVNKNYLTKNENIGNDFEDFKGIISSHRFVLDSLANLNTIKSIKQAANLIHKSRNVYLIGVGSSQKIISEFYSNLLKIGLTAIMGDDFHIIIPALANVKENDVLVVVSNKLMNIEIWFALRIAKAKKAKIIVITSNAFSKIDDLIDIKIQYQKIHDEAKVVPVSSKLAQLVIVDLLFESLIKLDNSYKENLMNTKIVLDKWLKKE
ncbi:MurR/RpiR family transcriptional regulator [Mycoplasma crocodyli]|uniref:Hypothetical HTH-type transcriptional regulator, RpiR family n=1 Tax=Mycoplasma crocodyli (strain ATCC 51981 / MP145) TaxID=512564 RepID=D5E514_MYCCM|nr:MurR/RpiR family transcriptional regulator [Mycoplasma crocodyli]ADE19405.1 hypothetical HTH-type transcriptional regulator, RpiR family [Mycoplasma crocodyli MP145]